MSLRLGLEFHKDSDTDSLSVPFRLWFNALLLRLLLQESHPNNPFTCPVSSCACNVCASEIGSFWRGDVKSLCTTFVKSTAIQGAAPQHKVP